MKKYLELDLQGLTNKDMLPVFTPESVKLHVDLIHTKYMTVTEETALVSKCKPA